MQMIVRSVLLGALALAPTAALAQLLVEEPLVIGEPVVVGVPVGVPVIGPEGLTEEDARVIAMMHGMVEVEDVDERFFDGNFEVEGADAAGNDLEITIDGETGEVIEVDD